VEAVGLFTANLTHTIVISHRRQLKPETADGEFPLYLYKVLIALTVLSISLMEPRSRESRSAQPRSRTWAPH
jgi:hypothetical protein